VVKLIVAKVFDDPFNTVRKKSKKIESKPGKLGASVP
jgi:hypothetical protein